MGNYGIEVFCCCEGCKEPGVCFREGDAVVYIFLVSAKAGGELAFVNWISCCKRCIEGDKS